MVGVYCAVRWRCFVETDGFLPAELGLLKQRGEGLFIESRSPI